MRAHQVMTKPVITVTADTSIVDAANVMLRNHISGLPVTDASGKLIGIVSEGDFLRRSEIGTQKKRSRWLSLLAGPGKAATEFVQAHGRKVGEIMTTNPATVTEDTTLDKIVALMEKHHIKRVPVMRGDTVVGIVSRSNLLQAVAGLAREIPGPTADDDQIRDQVTRAICKNEWQPYGLNVVVNKGVVHLNGVITDERTRQAAVVAAENVPGVKEVHDHLCWVDPMSGTYLPSPEDDKVVRAS